jgi:heat shock protein HslJ
MKTLIVFLIPYLLVGCFGETNPVLDNGEKIPFETILQSSSTFTNDGLITVVLRSEQEEFSFLASHSPVGSFPNVDYQRQMVVGILLGMRGSVSIRVTIDSLQRHGGALKVYSHEFHPFGQYMAIGYPSHLIVINKTHLPVVFERIRLVRESSPDSIYGRWIFRYFETVSTGERDLPPSEMGEVTIEFSRESSFGGRGPCNSYGGDFHIHGTNGVTISSLRSTLTACALNILNEWEGRYFNALQDARTYHFTETELKLFFDENRRAIVYNRSTR